MDELKEKAKEKLGTALKHVKFVFIIPRWRKEKYVEKAQNQTSVIHLTGELKKDNKKTLQEAIPALNDLEVGEREELNNLCQANSKSQPRSSGRS